MDDGHYHLKNAGFGSIAWNIQTDLPGSGYFQSLGYPNQT
jgi:hypothetical protein